MTQQWLRHVHQKGSDLASKYLEAQSYIYHTWQKKIQKISPLHWPTGENLARTVWRHQMWLISSLPSLPCINIYMIFFFFFSGNWCMVESKFFPRGVYCYKDEKQTTSAYKGKCIQNHYCRLRPCSHRVYQCIACMRSMFTCTGMYRCSAQARI